MTDSLDPDALEAGARALAANDPMYVGKPWRTLAKILQEMFRSDAEAAIRAYLSALPKDER